MAGRYVTQVELRTNIEKVLEELKETQDRVDKLERKDYKINLDIDTKTLESAIQKLDKMLDSLGKGTGDFKQFENLSKQLESITSDVKDFSKAFGKVDDSGTKTLLSSIQNIDKSLSELSQNILNVNKNMSNMGGNTSGAVKQVENISNAYQDAAKEAEKLADAQSKIGQKTNISLTSDSTVEQQIKSELELNAEIEKRENIIRELQQLQEKLTVHEDFHGNDRYFADQLPTEEEIREADKRIKQLTGTNNIFNVDKLIQDRNEWLSEVKYSLEEYDDLIKANDQKALDEYTTRGLSRIGGAESFFGYEDNNFSIASKFVEEKEKIQNEINDLYTDLDKLDEKMNLDSNNSSVDNTVVQSQEKLQSELKETQKQAEKTAQAVKESTTASTEQKKGTFPKTSENLEQVAQSEQKVQQEAVATDKALDNISFTPNTDGFDDIIAKFGILREQAEQITKIVKTTKQTADGTPDISYKATLRNGSSYYLGENSTPQVLNASETVYDTNTIEKAYQEATKVNNALNETNSLLNSLKIPNGFEGSFSTLESEIKRLNSEFGSGKISATEYANDIKKAFSNYQTPIDNRSKNIWNELNTSLDRYATLQKRIASNNVLSTDNEEATKLLEHIHELQRNDILSTEKLTASNEKLQQINQTVTDLKAKLKESTLDSLQDSIDKYQKIYNQRSTYSSDFTPSEQYTKNLTELNTAIGNLVEYRNTLKNVSEVTVEQETHLKGLVAACEKASDSFKSLSASEKGASQIAVDKLVQRINKDLDECTNYSKEAKLGLRSLRDELESANPRNLKEITSEIINIENAEIRAGRAGRSFFDTLKNSGFHQIAAQMAGMFGFYDVINLGKEGLSVVRELNTALTEMRKVSDESLQSLKNYQNTTFDVADAVGTTAKQIQASTADYMRLGESLDEAAESAKTANVLLNVSEFDNIEDATKSLVAMGQAYKDLDKMTIVDKLNEVGNNYAISTDELATALQKSAATLSLMGNTIDEAASLVTTANATIQDADSVSAGLRTISLRLVGTEEAEEELSAMNEEVDAFVKATNSKKQQIIKDYTAVASNNYQGFDILDNNGNYKNTYQILLGIAKVYKEIQEQDKKLGTNHATALIEELAGKNRSNIASAILQDPTQLEAVKKSSEEAMGSAEKELNSYLDSIDGKMAQLENRAQEFWFKVIDSETIKNGIDLLSTLLKGATDFVDTVGLLPTILTGVGAALSFKNVGRDKMYSLSFKYADNIHNLLWIQRFKVCYS